MSNIEKYKKVFIETFSVSEAQVESLKYESIDGWDSIGHMELMGELEEEFDITLETDDIIEFAGFEEGKVILKKYGVEVV